MTTAQATVDTDINIPALVKACGKSWTDDTAHSVFWMDGTTLFVADCEQSVLDTAVSSRNASADKFVRDIKNLRGVRNNLLSESDWTQLPDAQVNAAAWATYRQALRDLPANTADPVNPVWPTKP
jgi:hypothetical protein